MIAITKDPSRLLRSQRQTLILSQRPLAVTVIVGDLRQKGKSGFQLITTIVEQFTRNPRDQSSDILGHSQNRPTGDRQIKIKIWQSRFQEKVLQIQVVYKNTLPSNNTGYGWYIDS